MSEVIDNEVYYTAKEITELCNVTPSAFNNAVYRHSLARIMHNKHWHYPQSSLDAYQRICTRNTTPLQSQSEPTELPPAALQSLDPLDESSVPYVGSFDEEIPEPAEEEQHQHDEAIENEVSAAVAELSFEEVMFRSVMTCLRRQALKEQRGDFIAELKGLRSTVTTLIDAVIASYEASDDDISSQ